VRALYALRPDTRDNYSLTSLLVGGLHLHGENAGLVQRIRTVPKLPGPPVRTLKREKQDNVPSGLDAVMANRIVGAHSVTHAR
jgi:hypothetical protein